MSLVFYNAAGSPYTRRVAIALRLKKLAHEERLLAFDAGDTKTAGHLARNPRGRVPVIDDHGFVLYESPAIVEYLEEQYPATPQLFPGNTRERALIRRVVSETDQYVSLALDRLWLNILAVKPENFDEEKIAKVRDAFVAEMGFFARMMNNGWLCGRLTAADIALYPMVAFALRCEVKKPDLGLTAALPASIMQWMAHMDAMPDVDATMPAHWRAKS
jgi:glutathione S-transferase